MIRETLPGLGRGDVAAIQGFLAGLALPPEKSVAEWAEQSRYVAPESGSPYPGKWSNGLTPYVVEVMECLSFSHPCRDVTLAKSHQSAGTEVGVNLFGYVVDEQPGPVLIVLPTIDEAKKFNRIKLQPTIEATPALRHKVKEAKGRGAEGSTTVFKKFRGGFAQITGANASTGLQMISVRVLHCSEISEWPSEAGGRGDPLEQAEKRTTAWSNRKPKRFYESTPGNASTCRITKKYEASDQRRYYVSCPSCGDYFVFVWERFGRRSDVSPHGTFYVCPACGSQIEHFEKREMVAKGVWIKTYPGEGAPGEHFEAADLERHRDRPSTGREPGFHIWQAYSPFVGWDDMMADWLAAEGDLEEEKVFVQQVLGEAWDETGEAPSHEKLFERRENYPLGAIPSGALILTGFADVQVNRIEWGVYGWGIGLSYWLVDKGIIEGDPEDQEVWKKLDEVVQRQYQDWQGSLWPVETFGVDDGYKPHQVRHFCRGRERVFDMKGQPGQYHPYIGTPKREDINWHGKKIPSGVMQWPTGTWSLKSWVYGSLRRVIEGPDADGKLPPATGHFPEACDETFFRQVTAEYLDEVKDRRGQILRREWVCPKGRGNEQLDMLVGARALASHLGLDRWTEEQWAYVARERGAPGEKAQQDLADLWRPAPTKAAVLQDEARVAAARRLAQLNN